MNLEDFSQLEEFLACLPCAACICSNSGRVLSSNAMAAEIWGRDPSNTPGFTLRWESEQSPTEGSQNPRIPGTRPTQVAATQSRRAIVVREDGAHIAVRASSRPIVGADGEVQASVVLVNGQPDLRPDERASGRSTIPSWVINDSAEGICVFRQLADPPFIQFSVWNERMTEITGYTQAEVNEFGWTETMYRTEEQRARAEQCFAEIAQGKSLRKEPKEIVCKDGRLKQLRISTSFVDSDSAEPSVVALIQDVTEESRIRDALAGSEQRLKFVMEAGNLGLWDWDIATGESYFSPEWYAQLGLKTGAEQSGWDLWTSRIHEEDRQRVLDQVQRYLDRELEKYDIEFRMRHEDGSYRWIHSRGAALRDEAGDARRMIGCHMDVSERKRTEETLRYIIESVASTTGQEFFSKLVDYCRRICKADYAFVAEVSGSTADSACTMAVSCRDKTIANFSYDLAGTPCREIWDHCDVCEFDRVQEKFPDDQILRELNVHSYMAIPLRSSNDEPIGMIVLLRYMPFEEPEQARSVLRVLGARCGAELERVRTENALRKSELRFRSIVKTLPEAVFVLDLVHNRIDFFNDKLAQALGYTPEEFSDLLYDSPLALLHPEDQSDALARIKAITATEAVETEQRALVEAASTEVVLESTRRMRHKSGQWRWFNSRATVYERDLGGRPRSIIGIAKDATEHIAQEAERKRLEARMQRSQKLESLGVLAGGIAHDFNNLLTSITGFAELGKMALPAEDEVAGYLKEIIAGAKSASELTSQLLAYSGKGTYDVQRIDLSRMIQDTSRLLHVSISKRCQLHLRLADDLPACRGDIGQLRQVIMNLIINASEAIGDNAGNIKVSVHRKSLADGERIDSVAGDVLEGGDYVCLDVTDDGCGMSAEVQQRIFDPFFTTKFSGRGLGMSAVLGIVHGHGGALQVHSQQGVGSCFRVWLPVTTEADESLHQPEVCMAAEHSAGGRILLADDEDGVLRSTAAILRKTGYEVDTASDGAVALDLFCASPDDYDFVILDVTMPNLGGEEACAEVLRLREDMKVILISGYSAAHRLASEHSKVPLLQKPFRIDELLAILKALATE